MQCAGALARLPRRIGEMLDVDADRGNNNLAVGMPAGMNVRGNVGRRGSRLRGVETRGLTRCRSTFADG